MDKNNFLVFVGKRIAKARADREYSQATLAEKANISVSHLSNIERGRKSLSAEVLFKIAEALQVSTDSLLIGASKIHKEVEQKIDANINRGAVREKEFLLKLVEDIGEFIAELKAEKQ